MIQKILEDIENQKKKSENLLQLLPSQMQNASYKSSQHSSLMSEIEELHKSAKEHHEWLLKAVKQKEENDQEIKHVKTALSSVQTKLFHTYNTSADIEILRREKQENEVNSEVYFLSFSFHLKSRTLFFPLLSSRNMFSCHKSRTLIITLNHEYFF